jgi:hypothetical protein
VCFTVVALWIYLAAIGNMADSLACCQPFVISPLSGGSVATTVFNRWW